jgi:hypothetical protein
MLRETTVSCLFPTCFGKAGLSSTRTCKIQRTNYWSFTFSQKTSYSVWMYINKGNCCPVICQEAQEGGKGIALPIPTTALQRGEWSVPRPARRFTPGKETLYPLYRGARWTSGTVWMCPENLSPTGFEPRTVNSRCTDHAIPAATPIYFENTFKMPQYPQSNVLLHT